MSGRLPSEMEDALGFLREQVERLAEEAAPRPAGDSAQLALGFAVEVVDVEKVRGNYDVSRLQRDNPRLVGAITALLGMHFLRHEVIASICGVSWETVAAVASQRSESIREFKGRMASRLGLLMEAMTPVLLEKIKLGKVGFLDLKLLHEVWAPLAGEATGIMEKRTSSPALEALMQTLAEEAGKQRDAVGPAQMGLEEGKDFGGVGPVRVLEADFVELGDTNNSESTTNLS